MFEYKAEIVSTYDGDTLRADVDLGFGIWAMNQSFRLNGLNAPELVKGQPAGLASRDYLRSLLPVGTQVRIVTLKDKTEKYGRMLAEVYEDVRGIHINQMLIEKGFAKAWDGTGERPV